MVEVDKTYQFQSKVGKIDQALEYVSRTTYHTAFSTPTPEKKGKRERERD